MKKNGVKLILISLVTVIIIFGVIFVIKLIVDKKVNEILAQKEQANSDQISKIEEEKTVAIYDLNNELEKVKSLQNNVYDNPITVGLYTQSGGSKILTSKYSSNWDKDNIMGMFYTVYTNKSSVGGGTYSSVWNDYFSNYANIGKYKIGYNIKYTLKNGEVVDKQILQPKDTDSLFVTLQVYLYDDVTPMPGRRYYHMTQPEVTDKTIYTSIKIVAYKETVDVASPIELTAFTYDGKEDFDSVSGKYIGKSLYKTIINRQ